MILTEKIYEVEFMQYTNSFKEAVSDEDGDKYITIGKEPFLVRESELEKYQNFGGGFRMLKYVGNIGHMEI